MYDSRYITLALICVPYATSYKKSLPCFLPCDLETLVKILEDPFFTIFITTNFFGRVLRLLQRAPFVFVSNCWCPLSAQDY